MSITYTASNVSLGLGSIYYANAPTGADNTNGGYLSLGMNGAGGGNTAFGSRASNNNTVGTGNTALGSYSLYLNTGGTGNVAIGNTALFSNSGSANTAIGFQAGYTATGATGCVYLGFKAGYSNTGSNKLFIANNATGTPLIYGDFGSSSLTINGSLFLPNLTPSTTGGGLTGLLAKTATGGIKVPFNETLPTTGTVNYTTTGTNARGDYLMGQSIKCETLLYDVDLYITGSTRYVDINDIPTNFRHLRFLYSGRSTNTADHFVYLKFNSTGSSTTTKDAAKYIWQYQVQSNGGALGVAMTDDYGFPICYQYAFSGGAWTRYNACSSQSIVWNYNSTDFYKPFMTDSVCGKFTSNGTSFNYPLSMKLMGSWRNCATTGTPYSEVPPQGINAITCILWTAGFVFCTGSRLQIYGVP